MPAKGTRSVSTTDSLDEKIAANNTLLQEILLNLKSIDKKIDRLETTVSKLETSVTYHSEIVEELKLEVDTIKSVMLRIEEKVNQQNIAIHNKT